MTEPSDRQLERQAEAAADPGLEVRPEVIKDLDVTGDDAGDIHGGRCGVRIGGDSFQTIVVS
ncbi:MAG TPA: hypothetical protein VIX86_06280 [Streptosporangiaceae bacterium]